jgi:hypothetical protein
MTRDTQWKMFWMAVFVCIAPVLFLRDVVAYAGRLGPFTAASVSIRALVMTAGDVWRGDVL